MLRKGLFKSTTPQFLYCSFDIPHPPHVTNKTFMDKVQDLGDFAVPKWAPRDEVHPADKYTSMVKGTWAVDESMNPKEMIHNRQVYFAQCVEMDRLIGRVLDDLDYGGGKDNAYIIFASDHGDHNYENRMIEKESLLEASARVPIIISGPGIHASSARTGHVASLHDIFPTVLDIAGFAYTSKKPLAGESLLPLAKGTGHRKKDFVVAEYHARHTGTGVFMIRQGDYKLMLYGGPQLDSKQWPPQLYNLANDPHEFHDLAHQESSAHIIEKMTKHLSSELDMKASDRKKKAFDKYMFKHFYYDQKGGADKCGANMKQVFKEFSSKDAKKLATWLGSPCHM
jgi:arylsulfatase A-like enzyme